MSPQPAAAADQASERFVNAHKAASDEVVYGIGELATELGITQRAIRFYESKGLVTPRRSGNTRIYGKRERARLVLILRGKALGITLTDIKAYLDLYGHKGSGRKRQLEVVVERCEEMIEQLRSKQEQLEQTLRELELIRSGSVEALAKLSK